MMGKIKTLAKQHPALTALVAFVVVYPIIDLLGLPKIMIELGAIHSIITLGLAFYAGAWVAAKRPEWIERGIAYVYQKLNLQKYFGELEEKDELQKFIEKVERKRTAANKQKECDEVGSGWKDTFYRCISVMFERYEMDYIRTDSFTLAAIVAYSMTTGLDTRKQLAVVYEVIKDMLLNPYSCIIKRSIEDDYYEVYDLDQIKKLEALDPEFINEAQFKKEVIDYLAMYTADPKDNRRLDALIEVLRENTECNYAF